MITHDIFTRYFHKIFELISRESQLYQLIVYYNYNCILASSYTKENECGEKEEKNLDSFDDKSSSTKPISTANFVAKKKT